MRITHTYYRVALAVCFAACGGETTQAPIVDAGPLDIGADLGNPELDADTAIANPYGPCDIVLEVPTSVTRGVVNIKATVTHPDGLTINTGSDNAGGFVLSPTPELLAQFEIGNDCAWYDAQPSGSIDVSERINIPAEASEDGTFTLSWDSGDIPLALSCANVIVEMALPDDAPDYWVPPTCAARATIAVDNQAPECDLSYEDFSPINFEGAGTDGVYIGSMPFQAQFKENALLESITITTVIDGEPIILSSTDAPTEVFEEGE